MSSPTPTREMPVLMDRAFEASSLDGLQVYVPDVHVRLRPHCEEHRVHIRGFIPDSSADRDPDAPHSSDLTTRRSQTQLSVVGNRHKNDVDTWRWRRKDRATLHLDIRLPAAMDVDVETPGGTVIASNLSGETALTVIGGSIEVEHLQGVLNVRGGGGSLTVQNSSDLSLDLQWKSGTVALKHIEASSTALYSVGAPVTLQDIHGSTKLTVHGAPLTLQEVGGDCEAHVHGGAIHYSGAPTHEINLRAVGKPVQVHLPVSHAAEVRLSGASVSIDDAFSFEGETNSHRTEGLLNGGGPPLHLQAVQGSVHCGVQ